MNRETVNGKIQSLDPWIAWFIFSGVVGGGEVVRVRWSRQTKTVLSIFIFSYYEILQNVACFFHGNPPPVLHPAHSSPAPCLSILCHIDAFDQTKH